MKTKVHSQIVEPMDDWTLSHLNKWLAWQFNEDDADTIRPHLIAKFNSDPEFWASHSYLTLFDSINGRGILEESWKPE